MARDRERDSAREDGRYPEVGQGSKECNSWMPRRGREEGVIKDLWEGGRGGEGDSMHLRRDRGEKAMGTSAVREV